MCDVGPVKKNVMASASIYLNVILIIATTLYIPPIIFRYRTRISLHKKYQHCVLGLKFEWRVTSGPCMEWTVTEGYTGAVAHSVRWIVLYNLTSSPRICLFVECRRGRLIPAKKGQTVHIIPFTFIQEDNAAGRWCIVNSKRFVFSIDETLNLFNNIASTNKASCDALRRLKLWKYSLAFLLWSHKAPHGFNSN